MSQVSDAVVARSIRMRVAIIMRSTILGSCALNGISFSKIISGCDEYLEESNSIKRILKVKDVRTLLEKYVFHSQHIFV